MDKNGWMLIHELGCPGYLMHCEMTVLLMALSEPPKTGVFEATYKSQKDNSYKLVIGPPVTGSTALISMSKRNGHVWKKNAGGIDFGRKQQ